jgi:hypothetical protein
MIRTSKRSHHGFLFAIAGDCPWPYGSNSGDKAAKTPTFDQIAREGVASEGSQALAAPFGDSCFNPALSSREDYNAQSELDEVYSFQLKYPEIGFDYDTSTRYRILTRGFLLRPDRRTGRC